MIVAIGEALIDLVPADGPNGDALLPCPGGSPYNTAIAAARLGAGAAFIGRLSTDPFGERLYARLAANGVGEAFISRTDRPTSLAVVQLNARREARYAFYLRGTADASLSPADLPDVPDAVEAILFGSISLVLEPLGSAVAALVRREAGRRVLSFDPNIRPDLMADRAAYLARFEALAALAHIVKLSDADLAFLYPGAAPEAALSALEAAAPAARLIALTRGADGATLVRRGPDGRRRLDRPARPTTVVDTIGAGDTFHAALAAFLSRLGRLSPERLGTLSDAELGAALDFAQAAAALVCARRGAEPPTLAETEASLG
jgi:fructokinase